MLRIIALLTISLYSPHPDLQHTAKVWQSKLRLTGWSISVEVVADKALGGDSMGDIEWDVAKKQAAIRILREEDYDLPPAMARRDQEATLVHELVHLLHANDPDAELAVVRQTNALLRANHKWRILAVQDY